MERGLGSIQSMRGNHTCLCAVEVVSCSLKERVEDGERVLYRYRLVGLWHVSALEPCFPKF